MKSVSFILLLLLAFAPETAAATTKPDKVTACLAKAHARDVTTYCALKRGSSTQRACVKQAATPDAKRACLVPPAAVK